jgi:hypothetical protein
LGEDRSAGEEGESFIAKSQAFKWPPSFPVIGQEAERVAKEDRGSTRGQGWQGRTGVARIVKEDRVDKRG